MIHSFEPFRIDAAWLLTRATGIDFRKTNFRDENTWLCVTGRDDAGQLLGLAAFEFKTAFDAHFTAVILDPRCLTRRLLQAMFQAVFSRAVRVTALIEPVNARAIRQARRMGFQEEGFMRLAIEGQRDALLFGMLRNDCRYLWEGLRLPFSEVIEHGQQPETA
jgi:RimJ/RimL family protein N-acetyltransferase